MKPGESYPFFGGKAQRIKFAKSQKAPAIYHPSNDGPELSLLTYLIKK